MKQLSVAFAALLLVAPGFAQEPRKIGPGVNRPKLVQKTDPGYTQEARDVQLEGTVKLTLTIDAEGRPKDIRVTSPLGLGLDEKAIEAVSKWKFEPATLTKDNTPIPVIANIEVNFRLL